MNRNFDPKEDMPVRYMKNKSGLRVHRNNLKNTWVLMFNDYVCEESSDAQFIRDRFEDLEKRTAYVIVRNHYPEDSEEIARRIKNILGEYHHEGRGAEIIWSRDHRGHSDQTLRIHFYRTMKLDFAKDLLARIYKIITPSFSPGERIEITLDGF